MLENKDQEIKVFGWMLQLGSKPEGETVIGSKMVPSASTDVSCECTSFDENLLGSKQSKTRETEGCSTVELMDMNQEDESCTSSSLEECKTPSSVITYQNPKTSSNNQNSTTQDLAQRKDHQTSESDKQNTLKKPEEILPCPRCKSMNTKFCYFNNYNVNQPRHFCKNCQRYWTAGGCMRNVAVGSGRRKSKTSHATFQPDSPTGPNFWPMRPNGGDTTSQNGPMRPKMGNPMGNEGVNWPTYGWSPIPWQSGYHPQWVCHFVPNPPIGPNPNTQPFLGKHSRDGTLLVPSNNSNNTIPSTLRINDDPIEVSRSSVWGSLEVEKNNKARSSNIGSGFFWGLDRKGVDPSNTSGEGSHLATQANPAATRRSLSFHEVGEQGCNK